MSHPERRKFSKLRQILNQLSRELTQQSNLFFSDKPLIKGSIYELKRKCGKSGCRCAQGQLHSCMVVNTKKDGKTKLRVIPKGSLVEVQIKVKRYQKLRNVRSQMIELHRKMLETIDQMESMRLEEMPTLDKKRLMRN